MNDVIGVNGINVVCGVIDVNALNCVIDVNGVNDVNHVIVILPFPGEAFRRRGLSGKMKKRYAATVRA